MKRFQLHNLRAGPTKIPRACELHCDGVARHVEPPDVVTQHLSNELVVGVDVDTHDWGNKCRFERWYRAIWFLHPLQFQHWQVSHCEAWLGYQR